MSHVTRHASHVKIIVFSVLFFVCGCGSGIQALVTLAGEQKAQQQQVSLQRKKIKILLSDIKKQKLCLGKAKKDVVSRYGEPVIKKDVNGEDIFIYRDPVDFLAKEKVYLFFDKFGKLKEHRVAIDKEE